MNMLLKPSLIWSIIYVNNDIIIIVYRNKYKT